MSQLKIKQILELISASPSDGDVLSFNSSSGKYENSRNATLNDLKVKGSLKRDIITVNGVEGAYDIAPDDGDAFLITVQDSGTPISILMRSIAASNYGQSGTILIVNSANGASFNQLPSYMKTPSGADINFATGANAVSIISYFIIDANNVLCNYVGNFS
jgi:hypothetical protein